MNLIQRFKAWTKRKATPQAQETIVFSGAMGITRKRAVSLAKDVKCAVRNDVSSATTILVCGEEQCWKHADGNLYSAKRRKAETLIEAGQSIRIIGESAFLRMIKDRL